MIKLPLEALVSEDEAGAGVTPEVGDAVSLEAVEGNVAAINDDGTVHVELAVSYTHLTLPTKRIV